MNKKTTTKINIAYPVFFLNPVKADDWSSFFVINHIYPRFSAEIGEFRSNSILKNKKVSCAEDGKSILASSCKRVKVEIGIKNDIKMCNGQIYKLPNFIYEFEQLTNHKNWLFPGYETCPPQKDNAFCFSFKNDVNIDHVLRSIYLRFGWSMENADFGVRGVMPNCFYPKDVRDSIVYQGTISTPKYELLLTTKDEDSDLILYGNKADDKRYKSLGYYNPIYYFLITSGEIEGFDLPWSQDSKMVKVKNLFELNKVTVKNYNADILTKDMKKNESTLKRNKMKAGLKLTLPDYFSNCAQLASGLKEILDKENVFKLSIPCSNISSFVDNTVKVPGKKWDAYITPLTPGLPGNSALQVQYFSPTSNESWLGKNSPEDSKVYFLGTTDGIVQTRPGRFCSVKPNALGLSDFTFDDLILCDN